VIPKELARPALFLILEDVLMNNIEIVWEALLSRDEALIRPAYLALDAETRRAVGAHLRIMTGEDGWHPEQVISAQAALDVIAAIDEMEGEA
jgi:hypothetical protein